MAVHYATRKKKNPSVQSIPVYMMKHSMGSACMLAQQGTLEHPVDLMTFPRRQAIGGGLGGEGMSDNSCSVTFHFAVLAQSNSRGCHSCALEASSESHCDAERMVYLTKPALSSFDWSDFPCIGQSSLDEQELELRRAAAVAAYSFLHGQTCASTASREQHRRQQDDWEAALGLPSTRRQSRSQPSKKKFKSESETRAMEKTRKGRDKKSVTFSKLEIREHSLIVGDHPCCESGLPISLGWEHTPSSTVFDLDTYEQERCGKRRTAREMRLTYYERKNLLKRVAGLTETDLIRAERRRVRQAQREEGLGYLKHVPSSVSLLQLATATATALV